MYHSLEVGLKLETPISQFINTDYMHVPIFFKELLCMGIEIDIHVNPKTTTQIEFFK
jgi:hypothetical protein